MWYFWTLTWTSPTQVTQLIIYNETIYPSNFSCFSLVHATWTKWCVGLQILNCLKIGNLLSAPLASSDFSVIMRGVILITCYKGETLKCLYQECNLPNIGTWQRHVSSLTTLDQHFDNSYCGWAGFDSNCKYITRHFLDQECIPTWYLIFSVSPNSSLLGIYAIS